MIIRAPTTNIARPEMADPLIIKLNPVYIAVPMKSIATPYTIIKAPKRPILFIPIDESVASALNTSTAPSATRPIPHATSPELYVVNHTPIQFVDTIEVARM